MKTWSFYKINGNTKVTVWQKPTDDGLQTTIRSDDWTAAELREIADQMEREQRGRNQ